MDFIQQQLPGFWKQENENRKKGKISFNVCQHIKHWISNWQIFITKHEENSTRVQDVITGDQSQN